jgi:hypothetical protein
VVVDVTGADREEAVQRVLVAVSAARAGPRP